MRPIVKPKHLKDISHQQIQVWEEKTVCGGGSSPSKPRLSSRSFPLCSVIQLFGSGKGLVAMGTHTLWALPDPVLL